MIEATPPIPGFEEYIGVYVLLGKPCAILDIGPYSSMKHVLDALEELRIKPDQVGYLLLTHIHIDHAGAVGQAAKIFPKAKVVVSVYGAKHLVNPEKLWSSTLQVLKHVAEGYGPYEPVPEERVVLANEGLEIDLGVARLRVLETPGHARHHVSYFDAERRWVFAGDSLGVYIPSVDMLRPDTPPRLDFEALLNSLEKIRRLQPRKIFYAHFGWVEEAEAWFGRCLNQLLLWAETLCSLDDSSLLNAKRAMQVLHERDSEMKKLGKLKPERRSKEEFFLGNSLTGFLDYIQRVGRERVSGIVERFLRGKAGR